MEVNQNEVSQKQSMLIQDDNSGEKIMIEQLPTNIQKEPMKMLVAIVSRGFSSDVVEAAREAGSEGAVIIEGRALGKNEKKFFGLRIEPEAEMVFIAVPERICVKVSKAIYSKFNFMGEARGMVLVLPLSSYFI